MQLDGSSTITNDLNMWTDEITIVVDLTSSQDVATKKHVDQATGDYVDSVLDRKKLGSQSVLFTRTTKASLLEVPLNDSAGLTLELVFTITTTTSGARVLNPLNPLLHLSR